jgi:heavy metal efflux system protein
VEFYVGLKPYSQWHGAYRTKADLIEAVNEKLTAFPGITFNYTQPAEDAVDEAEDRPEERAGRQGLRA